MSAEFRWLPLIYAIAQKKESKTKNNERHNIKMGHPPSVYWRYFRKLPRNQQKAKCNLCGKVIRTTSGNTGGLKLHLKHVHPEVRSKLEKAKAEQDEEKRGKNGTGKYRSPKDCPECGKRLGNQRTLNKHLLLLHQKQGASEAFTCHLCGKTYGIKFQLDRHIENRRCLPKARAVPRDQRIPRLACQWCDRKFHNTSGRTKHMRTWHNWQDANDTEKDGELSRDVAEKPTRKDGKFVCDNCGKTWSRKSALMQHIWRSHSETVTQKPLESTRKMPEGPSPPVASGSGYFIPAFCKEEATEATTTAEVKIEIADHDLDFLL